MSTSFRRRGLLEAVTKLPRSLTNELDGAVARLYSAEEIARNVCRAQSRELQRQALLAKGPCTVCGTRFLVINHHPDYTDPSNIVRLCRYHHRLEHIEIDAGRRPPLVNAVLGNLEKSAEVVGRYRRLQRRISDALRGVRS